MRLQFPWAFLLLPLLALAVYFVQRKSFTGTLKFSSVEHAARSGASWRTRLGWMPLAMRVLALVLLIVGFARPQEGREELRDVSRGIAIEVVVDRSSSMGEEFFYEGRELNRLEAVKRILKEFILGDGRDLEGRPNDLIGLVAFARFADTVCPLTLSHGALDRFIDGIGLAVPNTIEDGTAIGDALALAAARLQTAEEQMKAVGARRGTWLKKRGAGEKTEIEETRDHESAPDDRPIFEKGYTIQSKIMILLTDGQNNFGRRSPQEAARMAREWGVKIYVVGIGGRESFRTIQTPFGPTKVAGGPGVDEPTLRSIAAETGGAYWMAESARQLHEIYKEIDKLERTEIESIRYVDYAEKFAPFALTALLVLCLEQLILSTVFRRVP